MNAADGPESRGICANWTPMAAKQKEMAETAVRNEAMWAAKRAEPPPDAPPDP